MKESYTSTKLRMSRIYLYSKRKETATEPTDEEDDKDGLHNLMLSNI